MVAALLGLLGWRMLDANRGPSLVSEIAAGKRPTAPEFRLPVLWPEAGTWPRAAEAALADGELALSELRGHPIVINFWASWCVPCKEEAPVLAAAARRHAGQVAFVGVDIQDFKSDARRFLTRYGVNYVSVRDSGDSTYRAYGLTGVPETYYVDREGRAVAQSLGAVSASELEAGIASAMESRE
ncbi:MAG: TlpA family protein disulfide reductase [Actinobacteria bacterium]|nr:TlpA family protein disulfide reductase [Actinomycetota bacterium]